MEDKNNELKDPFESNNNANDVKEDSNENNQNFNENK